MYLLAGVFILSLVVLVLPVSLIICRKPDPSWYGEENMQAYVWAPFCASGIFLGVLLVIKSLPYFPPSGLETVLVAITIAITLIVYKFIGVKKRLSAYQGFGARENIFPMDRIPGPSNNPSPPVDQGNTDLKKAA